MKAARWKQAKLSLLSLVALSASARALTLSEFMNLVREKNGVFQAAELGKEAALAKRDQDDLELSPYLTLRANWFDDQKVQAVPMFQGDRTMSREASLGVAKRFASGTAVELSYLQNYGVLKGAGAKVERPWTSAFTINFSQSLWRDAFGAATSIRRHRTEAAVSLETLGREAEARRLLVDAESAFWDAIYEQEEVRLRKDSLDRASRLVSWVSRRLSSGIGDRSDLLQAEALQSTRQIQFIGAEDEARSSSEKLANYVHSQEPVRASKPSEDFETARALPDIKEPVRIDALLKEREASVRGFAADEANDALKPELSLEGSVALNARVPEQANLWNSALDPHHPTTALTLRFGLNLDRGALRRVRGGLRAASKSARLLAEQAALESASSWDELRRRHQVLTSRIETAAKLVRVSRDKSRRENERLQIGRTTTFQVINFEQDQADAEILWLKLKIEQRKLEAQARLFVPRDIQGASK